MKKTIIYVSDKGNDKWSGKIPEPKTDGSDGPLATIEAARNAVRGLKRRGTGNQRVEVVMRGGTYYLPRTLIFTPDDSGAPQAPVIYSAYPGELPVISGGRPIKDWQVSELNGRQCWIAKLPEVAAGRRYFTQLFVNGRRAPRPRRPQTGYYQFVGLGKEEEGKPYDAPQGPLKARYIPGEIKNWKNLADISVVALSYWWESHNAIKKVDESTRTVYFRTHTLGNLKDEKNELSRYYLENIFEALDTPGQWYLARRSGQLYYLPLKDEMPENTEVVAPVLEQIVRFQGTRHKVVRDIHFENIDFRHAEWKQPPDDAGSIQAAFKVPGAIVFDRAENCVLYGCGISKINQYGVEILSGSSGNKIVACSIFDMGAGGVKIFHEALDRRDETCPAPINRNEVGPVKAMQTTVSDCELHDGGLIYHGAIGVFIGNSGRNLICHNHIYNMSYTGISCGWTWGYNPTLTIGNRIEHNHIHHINHQKMLSDNGGIYTLGIQPGGTVRNNLIHDVYYYGFGGTGIYPDQGSSEILFENNIVHGTQGHVYGLYNGGRFNLVKNNIFIVADSPKCNVVPGKLQTHRNSTWKHNIIYHAEGLLEIEDWPTEHYLFSDNLFWLGNGRSVAAAKEDLRLAQKNGQHLGAIIADPLLQDVGAGDFTLRRDSPALKIGFRPIDMSKAGPRYRGNRPAAFADFDKPDMAPREIVQTCLEVVESLFPAKANKYGLVRMTVKNLGPLPSSGKISLRAVPAGGADIRGKLSARFALKPGAVKSFDFKARARPSANLICLETIPVGKGLIPTLLLQERYPQVKAAPRIDQKARAKLKAKPLPIIRVPRLENNEAMTDPAKIDWNQAVNIGPWHTLLGDPTRRKIIVRLQHDRRYLFMRLEEKLADGTRLVGSRSFGGEDQWELFFAVNRGEMPYRQMMINLRGGHLDLAYRERSGSWESGVIAVSDSSQKNLWTVCLAFPLEKLLSKDVRKSKKFYGNFYRQTAFGELLAWSPNFTNSFHELSRLGEFVLA